MSMGVFVVDNSDQIGSSSCRAVLGYQNLLDVELASGSGVTNQDPNYPLRYCLDYSYFTEYSVNTSASPTTAEIIFPLDGVQRIDYFMMISKNAQSSQLGVTVEAFIPEDGSYVQVAGFGSMTDGKPVMAYFGSDFDGGYASATHIKVTLNYTSKPYIMTMMCGKAIVFPRTFSLGFQPGSLSYLDDVKSFSADEGLNVIVGRRLARGKQARGSINYVRMSLIESFWRDYANHVLDTKPVVLMWNDTKPDDVIYGVQNPDRLTKPSYKTSLYAQLDFDIVGWA